MLDQSVGKSIATLVEERFKSAQEKGQPSAEAIGKEVGKHIASAFETALRNHVPVLDSMFLREHIITNIKIPDRQQTITSKTCLEPSIIITKHGEEHVARVVSMNSGADQKDWIAIDILIEGPPAVGGVAGEYAALWGLHELLQKEVSSIMENGLRFGDGVLHS